MDFQLQAPTRLLSHRQSYRIIGMEDFSRQFSKQQCLLKGLFQSLWLNKYACHTKQPPLSPHLLLRDCSSRYIRLLKLLHLSLNPSEAADFAEEAALPPFGTDHN